jgi:endonuclease-3
MPDPTLALAAKIAAVHRRLGEIYGLPAWQPLDQPAIDELIGTFLSQNTSDANAARAFANLKAAYPTPQAVIDAPTEELAAVIRSGGLAQQKAPRIQAALRAIYHERGDFDLGWLAELPVDEARAWLNQLDGVGNKTASILLLFGFHRPAFPVDTHVHRLARRLGLAPAAASPDKVMHLIEDHASPAIFYPLHLNFIRHGRTVCKAQRPRCAECVLSTICDWSRANSE